MKRWTTTLREFREKIVDDIIKDQTEVFAGQSKTIQDLSVPLSKEDTSCILDQSEMINPDAILRDVLSKLGKKYEYKEFLGGGGFSNVYLIWHTLFKKYHALKIMDYNYIINQLKKRNRGDLKEEFIEIKERFINEAKLYEQITHANIVKVFDVDVIKKGEKNVEIPYIIMDYIEGANLSDFQKKGPLEWRKISNISMGVLDALDVIHKAEIIHRDIKPANIMIKENSEEAVLIDFGIAKDLNLNLTVNDRLMGTPCYMAPEQLRGFSKVTPKVDIYSFGVVMYEMLTGEVPFNGKDYEEIMNGHLEKPVPNIKEKNPSLPAGIEKIIYKAMAKKPEDRYENAGDFRKALLQLDKVQKGPSKPIIYLSIIIVAAIIVFIFLKPHIPVGQKTNGETTPVEKVTPKIEEEKGEGVAADQEKQISAMKSDFEILKKFLASSATNKEKLEKCRFFLKKYKNTLVNSETNTMRDEINEEIKAGEQYQRYMDTVSNLIKSGNYKGAKKELDKARKINDTDEVKRLSITINEGLSVEQKNSEKEYNAIKDKPTITQYKAFQSKYPDSIYLKDLRKKLPPGKYWVNPSLKLNEKGYYELTFGSELTGHQMIYIPGKNFWIDKYEVSWAQFRKYLKDENRSIPSIESNEYINNGDGYPAVVTFETAEKYCQKYGFQLPKEAEWEYAAGKEISIKEIERIYPWGNESPGENGIWQANLDTLEGDKDKDGYKGTAPVKSFEQFSSPFGVVNIAGNVCEWIQGKVLKGGGYLSQEDDLRIENVKQAELLDIAGFRCIKVEL